MSGTCERVVSGRAHQFGIGRRLLRDRAAV